MINTGLGSGYTSSLFSQSMAGFFHESKSAILDNALRQELVSKARVLATKVPLASAIINTLTRGVVGSGLHLSGEDKVFDIISATYGFDACRRLDIFQLQQQAFETMLLSGECWLIRQKEKEDSYSSWFLCEPDHIFTPPYISASENGLFYNYKNHLVIDGIEFNAEGKPLAIHYCKNPSLPTASSKKAWTRIFLVDKEGLPNVIHLYLPTRPEYPRGLPILAPLIELLYGLCCYHSAQIQMGILQSCQALVVKTTTNKTLNPFAPLSERDLNAPLIRQDDSEEKDDNKKKEFQITPPNNKDLNGVMQNVNFVVPGQTIHLSPDESLECVTPSGPSSSLTEYYNLVVEQCSSALGIPKCILTGVFDASFSASKASVAQWIFTTNRYRKAFVEQVLKPLYRVFLVESGTDLTDAYKESIKSEWILLEPSQHIDEVRTMGMLKDAYALGLITRDEIAETLFGHSAHPDQLWTPDTQTK